MKIATFRYDKAKNKIIAVEKSVGKSDGLPVSFVFNNEKGKDIIWCSEHRRYEMLKKNGRTESDCPTKPYLAYVNKQPGALTASSVKSIPWRWQVIHESGEYVELSIDTVSVQTEKKFIWERLRSEFIPVIKKGRAYVRYRLEDKAVMSNSSHNSPWDILSLILDAECWKDVSLSMMTVLQEAIKEKFDYNAILPTDMTYWPSDALLFMKRPFDFHIAMLQRFIGKDFERLFPISCTNNYPNLCYYLHIEPPKSIRKEYLKSPYLIILYFWLLRTGFKDINAIRLFFAPDVLAQINLIYARYDYRENELYHTGIPCDDTGMDFSFLVQWLLKNGKQEMVVARQVVSALKEGWTWEYNEMCRLFHELFPQMPQEIRDLVKENGFSTAGLRVLREEAQDMRTKESKVRLSAAAVALNQIHNDVGFRVIEYTSELPEVGRALHNCVATYADDVVKRSTVIVVGEKDGKYVACIELRQDEEGKFSMYQALGKFNDLLRGDVLDACRKWAKENQIIDKSGHI